MSVSCTLSPRSRSAAASCLYVTARAMHFSLVGAGGGVRSARTSLVSWPRSAPLRRRDA
jgi:hypothetical protein